MIAWMRTEDGWAVNLDGTDAALTFSLPRIELHTSPRGWSCTCHLANGTTRTVALGPASSVAAAMRLGVEDGLVALGPRYAPDLRALLRPRAVA
jgi:hypothetical protein